MTVQGIVYIVSAPSGAGKTTLVNQLISQNLNIRLSISHTTRLPRVGEQEGKDYYFVELAEFEALKQQGYFVETAEVFGNWYGTSKKGLEQRLLSGSDVILELDWQGAKSIRELFACVTIFILPPTKTALLVRLRARAQDEEAVIAKRMEKAVDEIKHYSEYDYIIVNEHLDRALDDLSAIIRAGHHSMRFQAKCYAEFISELIT